MAEGGEAATQGGARPPDEHDRDQHDEHGRLPGPGEAAGPGAWAVVDQGASSDRVAQHGTGRRPRRAGCRRHEQRDCPRPSPVAIALRDATDGAEPERLADAHVPAARRRWSSRGWSADPAQVPGPVGG